VGGVLLR
jgi:hypothetical protein